MSISGRCPAHQRPAVPSLTSAARRWSHGNRGSSRPNTGSNSCSASAASTAQAAAGASGASRRTSPGGEAQRPNQVWGCPSRTLTTMLMSGRVLRLADGAKNDDVAVQAEPLGVPGKTGSRDAAPTAPRSSRMAWSCCGECGFHYGASRSPHELCARALRVVTGGVAPGERAPAPGREQHRGQHQHGRRRRHDPRGCRWLVLRAPVGHAAGQRPWGSDRSPRRHATCASASRSAVS